MNKYIIYGLYCPITDNLHYVGKSSSYLTRPKEHLTMSHSEKINEWVTHLNFLGYKPIIKILEECTETNIDERELAWIKKSADEGCYLFNSSHNTVNAVTLQKEYLLEDSDILNIGKTINEVRRELDISQVDLAKMSGIHRETVRTIIKGDLQITIRNLKAVLNVLGLELVVRKK
jgi:ribosome-binding protein aMBF1 (putative translation factor)